MLAGVYLRGLFLRDGCPLRIGAWSIDLSMLLDDPLAVCLAVANWMR